MPKLVFDHTLKTLLSDIALPNWEVGLTKVESLTTVNVMGVRSPGLGMTFTFSRYWTYELMQTFLPSLMITITSVISVFIPAQHVPGRMGLCITAFLSLISLLNGSRYE